MFHNNLLIYLAFKESGNNTGNIQEALKKLEAKWLDKLQPYGEKGYNRKKEARK